MIRAHTVLAVLVLAGLSTAATAQVPPPPDAAWRAWLEQRAAVARRTPAANPASAYRNPNIAAPDAAWLGYSSSVTSGDTPAMPAPPQLYRYGPFVPYGGVAPAYGPLYVYPY